MLRKSASSARYCSGSLCADFAKAQTPQAVTPLNRRASFLVADFVRGIKPLSLRRQLRRRTFIIYSWAAPRPIRGRPAAALRLWAAGAHLAKETKFGVLPNLGRFNKMENLSALIKQNENFVSFAIYIITAGAVLGRP